MSAAGQMIPLADALNFTPEDLAANRAGQLSDAQKERLARGRRRTRWIVIGIVVAVGLLATMVLFLGQRNSSPILTVIGILLTVINAVTVAIGAQSYLRTSSDIKAGRVVTMTGVVRHTIRVSGRVATYILKIDAQELIVTKPVFFAVEDGQAFHFYRAPASKTLLAAERV